MGFSSLAKARIQTAAPRTSVDEFGHELPTHPSIQTCRCSRSGCSSGGQAAGLHQRPRRPMMCGIAAEFVPSAVHAGIVKMALSRHVKAASRCFSVAHVPAVVVGIALLLCGASRLPTELSSPSSQAGVRMDLGLRRAVACSRIRRHCCMVCV